MTRERLIIASLIVLLVASWLFGVNNTLRTAEIKKMYEARNDSIVYSNDSLKASISVFTAERERDFLAMKSNDEMIRQLQEVVRDYKGMVDAAIVASTETSTSGTGTTEITRTDTVFVRQGDTTIVEIYPEYSLEINDKWSIL